MAHIQSRVKYINLRMSTGALCAEACVPLLLARAQEGQKLADLR